MKLSLFCTILNLSTHINTHKSERETTQEWNKICTEFWTHRNRSKFWLIQSLQNIRYFGFQKYNHISFYICIHHNFILPRFLMLNPFSYSFFHPIFIFFSVQLRFAHMLSRFPFFVHTTTSQIYISINFDSFLSLFLFYWE